MLALLTIIYQESFLRQFVRVVRTYLPAFHQRKSTANHPNHMSKDRREWVIERLHKAVFVP